MIKGILRGFLLAGVAMLSACGSDDPMDELENPILPNALEGVEANLKFTTANEGAPYELNQEVRFTFSGSGMLFVDKDPAANNGPEVEMPRFEIVGSEVIWTDSPNGHKYALSFESDSSISEINLTATADNRFLGQFTPIPDPSNIANLQLVTDLAGTYTVANVIRGEHNRMTLTIGQDGSIDYDTDVQFAVSDIKIIYDRVSCCKRVQVSYGADDSAEVINLYLNDDSETLKSAQFRHSNAGVDIEVEVE